MLNTLRKDNVGPDLKQLFIGSEGTLGVITVGMHGVWCGCNEGRACDRPLNQCCRRSCAPCPRLVPGTASQKLAIQVPRKPASVQVAFFGCRYAGA